MPELNFKPVPGSWQGNDYKSVSMTSVSVGNDSPCALVFMTHMNADFDGAPNAYGPDDKDPLDSLKNAGRYAPKGYYGLVAVGPNQVSDTNPKRSMKDAYKLQLDERYPDHSTYLAVGGTKEVGRCPVVQQTGRYKGYFVSGTSRRNPNSKANIFHQEHYLDSSSVAFCALSYDFSQQKVGDRDLGIALRHDSYRTATFNMMGGEGHKQGTSNAGAVGECSYRVFLNIGGTPKKRDQHQPDNNFPTSFIVFPGSTMSQLGKISLADNSEDFAVFMAFQAEADARSRGSSGLAAFNKYKEAGRATKPPGYERVLAALHTYGYSPQLARMVNLAMSVARSL